MIPGPVVLEQVGLGSQLGTASQTLPSVSKAVPQGSLPLGRAKSLAPTGGGTRAAVAAAGVGAGGTAAITRLPEGVGKSIMPRRAQPPRTTAKRCRCMVRCSCQWDDHHSCGQPQM